MHLMEGKGDLRSSATIGRLVLPVIGGDRLIGILQLENDEGYGIQHVQLVSAVASQLGAYLAMARLVSECKLAAATIRYQEERLRKTEKLAVAGRMAGILAHEINNPLDAVGNVFYLLEHYSILDQDALKLVRTGSSELARISRIVKQSLSYYREGQTPHDLDLGEVAMESLRIFGEKFQKAGIELRNRIEGHTSFFGFPDEISQVLDNLLLNAFEATPSGGRVCIFVHPSFDWSNLWRRGIRLTIADTGSGIPKENRSRVFEPFFTTKGEMPCSDAEQMRALPHVGFSSDNSQAINLEHPECVRFNQIVIFGSRKKPHARGEPKGLDALMRAGYRPNLIPLLDPKVKARYFVPPSRPSAIQFNGLPLDEVEDALESLLATQNARGVLVRQHQKMSGQPVTPLHKGHVGLLACSGILNGLFGAGENRHIAHWRAVKHVDEFNEEGEEPGETIIRRRERFSHELTLAFESGRILELKETKEETKHREANA